MKFLVPIIELSLLFYYEVKPQFLFLKKCMTSSEPLF